MDLPTVTRQVTFFSFIMYFRQKISDLTTKSFLIVWHKKTKSEQPTMWEISMYFLFSRGNNKKQTISSTNLCATSNSSTTFFPFVYFPEEPKPLVPLSVSLNVATSSNSTKSTWAILSPVSISFVLSDKFIKITRTLPL